MLGLPWPRGVQSSWEGRVRHGPELVRLGRGPPHPSPIRRRGSGGLLGLLRVPFSQGEAGSQPSTDTWAYNPGAAPREPGIRPGGLREGHRPLRLGVYTWLQGAPPSGVRGGSGVCVCICVAVWAPVFVCPRVCVNIRTCAPCEDRALELERVRTLPAVWRAGGR